MSEILALLSLSFGLVWFLVLLFSLSDIDKRITALELMLNVDMQERVVDP